MQRKETFARQRSAHQGALLRRLGVRARTLRRPAKDWVKAGYAKGVPMGGDLPPPQGKAPTFVVWAVKDPTSGNLDRIQIVKGWTKNGQSFEKIFDVVWAGDRKPDKWTGVVPPIGSTVDIEKATYTNTDRRGRAEDRVDRSGVRSEPARLLLRPRAGDSDAALDHDPGARSSASRRPTSCRRRVQERAWSSPIWYTPSAEARKSAKPGITVADLTQARAPSRSTTRSSRR